MALRLQRITADGIGPLRSFELEPGDITVIEGDNEAGKSSIVVALHRALRATFHRNNAASFEGIRRNIPGYDGQAEVVFVDSSAVSGDGGAAQPPAKLCEVPLLWNLLIIPEGRAGTRDVGSSGDWLLESVQHLTGFDPDPLCRSLREKAGLTPTGRDTGEWSSRQVAIERQIGAIEEFLSSLDALGEQERRLADAKASLEQVEEEFALERQAVEFDRYRRGRQSLDSLEAAKAEVSELQRYTRSDAEAWMNAEVQIREDSASLRTAEEHFEKRRREISQAKEELKQLEQKEREAKEFASRVIGSGIVRRAEDVTSRLQSAGEAAARWRWARPAGIAGTAVGAIAAIAGFVAGTPLMWGSGFLIMISAIALLFTDGRRQANMRGLESDARAVVRDAQALGLDTDEVASVPEKARQRRSDAENASALVGQATAAIRRLEESLQDENDAIATVRNSLNETRERVAELRDRTGLATLAQLREKVERRQELERAIADARSVLEDLFDTTDATQWRERVASADVADPGRRAVPGNLEMLDSRCRQERRVVADLSSAIQRTIDHGLMRIGCTDQEQAREELERLEHEGTHRRRVRSAAVLALGAIEEAASDLESKLEHVLKDPNDGVAALLGRITGDRWSVRREEDGSIVPVSKDGTTIPVEALSRGTQDQLHFAIRAALAERVLGEPAFFVWDDTFLSADPVRRQCLVDIAVELARSGWQIIYLTVEPTIADLFERRAEAVGVKCERVNLSGGDAQSRKDRIGPSMHLSEHIDGPLTRSHESHER